MYSTDQKSQFIEMRAKGWSFQRISERLGIPKSTLIDWNQQTKQDIAQYQRLERDELLERLLTCHRHEVTRLHNRLERIETVLAGRDFNMLSTQTLLQQAANTRDQIRKLCADPLLGSLEPVDPAAPEPAGVTLPPVPKATNDPSFVVPR